MARAKIQGQSAQQLSDLQEQMMAQAVEANAFEQEDSGVIAAPDFETPVESLNVTEEDYSGWDNEVEPEPIGGPILEEPVQEAQAVSPEEQAQLEQRELERVPSPLEAAGVAEDLSNLAERVGQPAADRFRKMASFSEYFSPVTTPVASTANFGGDFQPNTREYSESLEASGAQELAAKPEGFVRMHKDLPLQANRTNIITHEKGLGIGIKNPKFEATAVKLNEAGKVSNYTELANVQPTIIDPRAIPNIAATIEDHLFNQPSPEAQSDSEALLDMSNPANERPDNSPQALGRKLYQTVRRDRAYRNGEPTDSYLEDYKGMTPAAFEAVNHVLMDLYAKIAPNMVVEIPGNWAEGKAKSYELSEEGRLILSKDRVSIPNFKADFLQTKPTDGAYQYENSLLKTATGVVPSPKSKALAEAKDNMSSVPVVIDKRRGDLILMLGVTAFGTSPQAGLGEFNYAHNMVGIGQQTVAKIQAIAPRLMAERDQLVEKAAEATGSRKESLLGEIAAKEEAIARFTETGTNPTSGTNSMRALFFQEANKPLQTLTTVVNQGDKPFYHSFVTQTGTQRLHTAQQGTFQQEHLMRQTVGSGIKYEIKPLGGTQVESNFLENVSVILFNGGKLTPDASVRNALGHIRNNSPVYKNAVAIGDKLKKYVGEFDRDKAKAALSGLEVTDRGLKGITGLSDLRPKAMIADVELTGFLEALSNQPKAHHNSIQVLDYLMALSDYEKARATGTTAHLSVMPVEIDGISNGLATLVLSLGLSDQQYRTGVLRAEGSEETLGLWKDIPASGDLSLDKEYSGDLRDTLDQMLKQNLDGEVSSLLMFDKQFQKEHGYTEEDIPDLRELIQMANQDKANFRKSPMLTFAYGQEAHNLIGSVYDTLTSNPALLAKAEAFPNGGGVAKAAAFLHGVRHQALEFALGPEVMELQQLLKEGVEFGQLYGKAITVGNPAGGDTSFVGKTTQFTGAEADLKTTKAVEPVSGSEAKLKESLLRRIDKAQRLGDTEQVFKLKEKLGNVATSPMRVKEKRSVVTPLASRGAISGGQARGQVAPHMAQSLDGATVVQAFSGKSWKKIADTSGFALPIFDAFMPDLGSMHVVREEVNNNWFNMASEAKIFKDFGDSVNEAAASGPSEFKGRGNTPINEAEHGMLADHIVSLLTFKPFPDEAKELAKNLRSELLQHKDETGVVVNEARTYAALEQAQQLLRNLFYSDFKPRYAKLMSDSEAGRKKIIDKVRAGKKSGQPILQYSTDDIGLSAEVLGLLK